MYNEGPSTQPDYQDVDILERIPNLDPYLQIRLNTNSIIREIVKMLVEIFFLSPRC